jgi:hypothetical protein
MRVVQRDLNPSLEQVNFPDNIVEERHDFNSAELITFKFQKSACCEELSALWRQLRRHKHELIIVNSLCLVVRLRQVVFQQVPQLLKVLLLQDFRGLILQEARASLLPHSEE